MAAMVPVIEPSLFMTGSFRRRVRDAFDEQE
jgi:hypothetical protein